MVLLCKVPLDNKVEVTIEQRAAMARSPAADPRESRSQDLLCVGRKVDGTVAFDHRMSARQKRRQTDARCADASLVQAHRPHSDPDDAACSGMSWGACRRGTAGEQEAAGLRAPVDTSTHQVPDVGM